jgi:hypothetical protein
MLSSVGEIRSHSRTSALENDHLGKDIPSACSGMAGSNSKTLSFDNSNSNAIPREILQGARSTAAIMASSLADVRTISRRPAFTSTVSFGELYSQ